MATHRSASGFVSSTVHNYMELNTIPALAGIIFAVAAGIQFLDLQITLGIMDYTPTEMQAMIAGLAMLVVAFASSETQSFDRYQRWEQITVGVAGVLIVGAQYVDTVGTWLVDYDPHFGAAAFVISMAAWAVLSR